VFDFDSNWHKILLIEHSDYYKSIERGTNSSYLMDSREKTFESLKNNTFLRLDAGRNKS
jgi:hypothetical protein